MSKWFEMKGHSDKTADIYMYEQIGRDWYDESGITAKDFVTELAALSDTEVITLHINSPGGSVFDGVAIYNALKSHPAVINVLVEGVAASIASVIAMAGDTITMSKGAMMMIHGPQQMLCGQFNSEAMKREAETLEQIASSMSGIYEQRSGKSAEDMAVLMATDSYFSAEEAVENGFADSVGAEQKIAASLTRDQVSLAYTTAAYQHHLSLIEATIPPPAKEPVNTGADAAMIVELCTEAKMPQLASSMIRERKTEAAVKTKLIMYGDVQNRLTAAGLNTQELMANVDNIPKFVGDVIVAMAAKSTPHVNTAIKPGASSAQETGLSSKDIYAKINQK